MDKIRQNMRNALYAPENEILTGLLNRAGFTIDLRTRIEGRAVDLVRDIRERAAPSMMELFLGEYGLSSEEGVALMCLAEALLRVPDADTMDALIEDKIAPSAWNVHLGKSHSSMVNASTWALFMTGKVLNDDKARSVSGVLHGAIKRLGEPVIRTAVKAAMKEMGRQFVLGETIEKAIDRARLLEAEGYTYSYDMLGEAARTDADAKRYHMAYADAITEIAKRAHASSTQDNPGISIKLSALHPRYEQVQKARVMAELMPRARSLALLAKSAGIGLNIDAEEAGRLDLSLVLIEAILCDPALAGWDGFGIVVQAYSKRASFVIDWVYTLARKLDRKIMVRLVKGAYWDTEIKHAQVEGLPGFPVFTRKPSTDVSYLCCAKKLLDMTDHIYPQFATHNAHSVAAILEMAQGRSDYEFQRLHGMGEALHASVHKRHGAKCRIYAPVGAHQDLLAYLVRRLLENGANSSFVNQIVDETVPPEIVAADPIAQVERFLDAPENPAIKSPADLFMPERQNSDGWDINDPVALTRLEEGIARFADKTWAPKHLVGKDHPVVNPTNGQVIGTVKFMSGGDAGAAADSVSSWAETPAAERAKCLNRAADLYLAHWDEFFALLMREAGKTLPDCIGELREAVDFLRYYAAQSLTLTKAPAGVFTCISPWNFPLAIFTGQIAAALAAGNGVLAKPAEATSLIADFAVDLLYKAGVPQDVLKLVAGTGAQVGDALTRHARVDGVCFTGSTATAKIIDRNMAQHLAPSATLIAETGGLNAMIVDSTALPEQAVGDIVASAFQSAGQRCSALRVLYLQDDIADNVLKMLFGAMDALRVGAPMDFSTDIGPVIDAAAKSKITAHIAAAQAEGRVLKQITVPKDGLFVAPTVVSVNGIQDLSEEIFGPVLHVAKYSADQIDQVIDAINATGYGLTFGLHTRIDDRVQHIVDHIEVGNIYVNRNQIGAVVGSQPFGGHGLSGTGPKAGGPRYLNRFTRQPFSPIAQGDTGGNVSASAVNAAFQGLVETQPHMGQKTALPGPTGESNQYILNPRKHVLCLGPTAEIAQHQAAEARKIGCRALAVASGVIDGIDGCLNIDDIEKITDLDAVVYAGDDAHQLRVALAARTGPLVPLVLGDDFAQLLWVERSICVDTTASGGNAELLNV